MSTESKYNFEQVENADTNFSEVIVTQEKDSELIDKWIIQFWKTSEFFPKS